MTHDEERFGDEERFATKWTKINQFTCKFWFKEEFWPECEICHEHHRCLHLICDHELKRLDLWLHNTFFLTSSKFFRSINRLQFIFNSYLIRWALDFVIYLSPIEIFRLNSVAMNKYKQFRSHFNWNVNKQPSERRKSLNEHQKIPGYASDDMEIHWCKNN